MKTDELVEKLTDVISRVDEPFITEKELSKKIKVSKVSLNAWRRDGRIPYYKLGRKMIRYRLSEVMNRIN
jgi:predicted site-specific integrase-resolvase